MTTTPLPSTQPDARGPTAQHDRVVLGEAEDANILGRASALTSINTIKPYGVPILRALFVVWSHVPPLTAKLRSSAAAR